MASTATAAALTRPHNTVEVPARTSIKALVSSLGLSFAVGSGYYELTKPEDISEGKQVVVLEKASKALVSGPRVRELLGIPPGAKKWKLDPAVAADFRVFVQSTSHNRMLEPGTLFLYNIDVAPAAAAAAAPAAAPAAAAAADADAPAAKRPRRGAAAAAAAAPAPVSVPVAEPPKKRGRGKAAAAAEEDADAKKKTKTEPAPPAASAAAEAASAAAPAAPTAEHLEVPMEHAEAAVPVRGKAYKVEIVFSFDTTGSMYPCLGQLRKNLRATIARLLNDIPDIRIGVIAHGDYCDGPRALTPLDFTRDIATLVKFVEETPATSGGDADENYEQVLRDVKKFAWSADADQKSVVLIGDNNPHPKDRNPDHIDWRVEADKLKEMNIRVHAVQALNYKHATPFYRELAARTGGLHINLDQFSYISDFVMAITLGEYSPEAAAAYETELKSVGSTVARSLHRLFDQLLGRAGAISADGTLSASSLDAVPPGRFQVLEVDKDTPIKDFAQANGLIFKQGKGFYEFTKAEVIQDYKEIVLMDKATGDMFTGDKARELLGIEGADKKAKVRPVSLDKYRVFVQSTSNNRKLLGGSGFLYEVDADK